MKVIHIESGLGNQMLAYLEYLAIKESNPGDDCYIETILSEVPECSSVISQWNGFELDRVFGINAPNIKELYDADSWKKVVDSVKQSHFWEHNWDYADAIVEALNSANPDMNLVYTNPWKSYDQKKKTVLGKLKSKLSWVKKTRIWYEYERWSEQRHETELVEQESVWMDRLFMNSSDDLYLGFTLRFRYRNGALERLENEYRSCFRFPALDEVNAEIADVIQSCDSVAIHARRGDMLSYNGKYYKYGYFKRACKYVRSQVKAPVFFIFCDEGSTEWCKENLDILGLKSDDKIYYVDWNKGKESYRDMQLMALCKHNIVTNSSFGLWGAWLNSNPDKITCCPEILMNTTKHF